MIEPIKRGDVVRILPEYQDPGDNDYLWQAVEDEAGGRVKIAPRLEWEGALQPYTVVETYMLA